MNCIVQIRILRFFLLSKALLPYNRILISLSWLSDGRDLSMLIKSFTRIPRISLKNWHRRKKCSVVSASICKSTTGLKCLQNYVEICAYASGWALISTWLVILYLVMNIEDFTLLGLIKSSRPLWKLL